MNRLMVNIPKGSIVLRDDRIKREWKVDIEPFLLSKHQVTQQFYFELTQKKPSFFKGDNLPVETVSWHESIAFCNLLSELEGMNPCYMVSDKNKVTINSEAKGYRLPTEGEWEYACRGGNTGPRYGDLDNIAWYKYNTAGQSQPVGEKMPNDWGLHDMLGNVWEWCEDLYDEEVYGTYRIFRGGGWSDEARGCLASNRRRSHPTFKIEDLGFRLAKSI